MKRERRLQTRILPLVAPLLLAGLIAGPVRAGDTEDELEAAQDRLGQLEQEAQAATGEFEAARNRFFETQNRIDATEAQIGQTRTRVAKLEGRLGERAHEAYVMGAGGMLEVLFMSRSVTEFSDRVVFLDRLARKDADLVLTTEVLTEKLRRLGAQLKELAEEQRKTVQVLDEKKAAVYDKLAEAQALAEELQEKLKAERAAAAAAPTVSRGVQIVRGGALQACPVPGASYADTYGAPRSGGRSHEGTDMMAPEGTPIHAAQSGSVSFSSSSLGGNQAYVYGDSGDTTFYAHLSGYAGGPRHVGAGEVIGYVGDTGNASGTPHLHFEYHPGGGGPTNPYPYLNQVC